MMKAPPDWAAFFWLLWEAALRPNFFVRPDKMAKIFGRKAASYSRLGSAGKSAALRSAIFS